MTEHTSLPIKGYRSQSDTDVHMVNSNKEWEERCLRQLDWLEQDDNADKRWLAIGRTHMEQAWMAINRAVFQPTRVVLPEDLEDGEIPF